MPPLLPYPTVPAGQVQTSDTMPSGSNFLTEIGGVTKRVDADVAASFLTTGSDFYVYTAADKARNVVSGGIAAAPYLLVADGQSDIDSLQAAQAGGDLTVDPNVFFWTGAAWVVMDPANGVGVKTAGRNSISFQAAKELVRQGVPEVYVINLGHAGNAIEQWMGDGTDSVRYVTLKSTVEAALASAEMVALGKTEIDGFIWAQGGSNNNDTVAEYRAKFETLFFTQLQAEDWFSTRTPVALQDLGMPNGFNKMDAFYTQAAMAEYPYMLVHHTDDLARDYPGDNNTHQTGEDMNESGRRAAQNLMVPRPALQMVDKSTVYENFTFWGETFFGNGFNFHYDTDTGQARMSGYNGSVGASDSNYFFIDYESPGANRMGVNSAIAFDVLGGPLSVEDSIFVNDIKRIGPLGYYRLGEYPQNDFLDVEADINTTDDKNRGSMLTNTTNNSITMAVGNADASKHVEFMPTYELTPGGARVPLDTLSDPRPSSFDTRADLVASNAALTETPPDGAIAFAGNNIYRYLLGSTAISDLGDWVPMGELVYLTQWDVAKDGTTDDATAFEEWIDYLDANNATGYIPPGTYAVSYVRNRALANSLNIIAHPEARIIGLSTKADVAGDDALTSYTVTEFTPGNDGFLVLYISGGVETPWTEDTEYTVSGQVINWGAGSAPHGALATGDLIRIVARDPMIELGQGSGTPRNSVSWVGGIIDNSLRGFGKGHATGSGLLFQEFDVYHVASVVFDGGDDCYTNRDNGLTDSGLGTVNCNSGEVRGCKFIGQADLGYYLSGGPSAGGSDNTRGHEIHGNWFYRCWIGGKTERQVTSNNVHDNIFEECQEDWLTAGVSQSLGGGRVHIHHNTSLRPAVRSFDARRSFDLQIDTNTIIDPGYELDGTTAVDDCWVIDIAGCTNVSAKDNIIRMDALATANQTAVRVRDENTDTTIQSTKVSVIGNKIDGMDVGIEEIDSGTGNVFRENEILNTNTEMDVISGRRWHYRESNVEYEGIGSTPFTGSWTPDLRVNNVAMGGTVSTAVGRYRRQGNRVLVSCELTVVLPGSFPSSGNIEIWGAPYPAINLPDVQYAGSISRISRIGASGERIGVELNANSTEFILFKSIAASFATSVQETDLIAGATTGIFFSMEYEVEPEAQN